MIRVCRTTDTAIRLGNHRVWNLNPNPVSLLRRGGVFIMFNDGKWAFYSASLLHVTLPQAEAFKEKYQEK